MTPSPPPQPGTGNTWHLSRGGQTYGPYTWAQVVEHARGGRIGRNDKLFDPRSGTWAKPSKVPGLLGPGGAATIPAGMSTAAMVAGTGMSGTVTKTNDVGSFVGGTFTGETISFDEYVNRPLIEGL